MEQVKFKQVAHLYIGCYILPEWSEEIRALTHGNIETLSGSKRGHIKPILRPLSDMTDEEGFKSLCLNQHSSMECLFEKLDLDFVAHMYYRVVFPHSGRKSSIRSEYFPIVAKNERAAAYQLSRNFDLFGLIENGEAIDATTLTQNPYKK